MIFGKIKIEAIITQQQNRNNTYRMLMSQKQKLYHHPPPVLQFDMFLKIRSQKQSIIQSQSQPIIQKVQGFQELLKLTKTGNTISTQHFPKKHFNIQLKTKMQSSKAINVMSTFVKPLLHTENQQNKFLDDFESDQAQLKKLNKMVFGITEWEEDRGKDSFHGNKKPFYPKTSYEKKRQTNLCRNQRSSQQIIKQKNTEGFTSCDNKKFKKFYAPLKKSQAMSELNRINSEFIRTSAKINYPPALLNCDFLEENTNNFKDLKNKIKMLQTKAINQYGLKFQKPETQKVPKCHVWDDLKENSEEKENEELCFSDLQLAPILAKQFPIRYKSYNQTEAEQSNPTNDTSIPKGLIDIFQVKSQSLNHQFALKTNSFTNPQVGYKKGKMKKGFLYRPKTFKPTYTYLKI